jgi:hypothetical protein
MEKAESVIDELLDWSEDTAEPTLSEIEEAVLKLRQQLSETMAREVIASQEAKQPAIGPACPKCGEKMTYKGQRKVTPQTWVGKVEIERGYYHCGECKVGFFPPG